ncbi:hypothetical protein SFRURICE_019176 [Spodoptera frugiperda]|nr:hypothetical protein SFRURICE_019176 [Spodoptera frugiperda]
MDVPGTSRDMPDLVQYEANEEKIRKGVCLLPYTGDIPDSVLLLRNLRKAEKSPVTHCPTRESNPRPLVRQSHLRPLDQRGSVRHDFFINCSKDRR